MARRRLEWLQEGLLAAVVARYYEMSLLEHLIHIIWRPSGHLMAHVHSYYGITSPSACAALYYYIGLCKLYEPFYFICGVERRGRSALSPPPAPNFVKADGAILNEWSKGRELCTYKPLFADMCWDICPSERLTAHRSRQRFRNLQFRLQQSIFSVS